jgi:molybdenum-dependent DNA-binding transcriptional regulator ModE
MEGGKISSEMNKAVDLFFKGGMVEGAGDNLRYTKAMDIVKDVPTYLRRRQELDQMIASSMETGRPTPLTAELTQFRQNLNKAARSNNDALRQADEKFAENRTTEKIIERGASLGKKLTPQTKQALRDFKRLTPTQQEIQRVAFENKMASEALNVKRGNAAADQFKSDAFDRIVEEMYPKSAGKDVFQRGKNLLKRLRTEATTTETARDVLSGSRTAPLQNDIAALMEGPRAAADLVTGRFGKILENPPPSSALGS